MLTGIFVIIGAIVLVAYLSEPTIRKQENDDGRRNNASSAVDIIFCHNHRHNHFSDAG